MSVSEPALTCPDFESDRCFHDALVTRDGDVWRHVSIEAVEERGHSAVSEP